jgi:hypothetical protein
LLSKLGLEGKIAELERIAPHLPAELTNQNWYTNLLTEAYVKGNQVEKFLRDLLPGMKPFPLGGLLSILQHKPEMERTIHELANKLFAEENYHLPLNMYWMHLMREKRFKEAQQVFDSCPKFKNQVLFNGVTEAVRTNKDIELAKEWLKVMLTTNVMPRALGVGYSAYVDALVDLNKPEEAEKMIIDEIINNPVSRVNSSTGEAIPDILLTDLNRMALVRLQHKMSEAVGRELAFKIPEKIDRNLRDREVSSDSPEKDLNEAKAKA